MRRAAACLLHGLLLLTPAALAGSCGRDAAAGVPCVDRISPTTGSIAGGQLITVHGANLWPDTKEQADPHSPPITVTIAGQPCAVQPVLSISTKLVCKTPPYAGADLGRVQAASLPRRKKGCASPRHLPVSITTREGLGGVITDRWNIDSGSRARCAQLAKRKMHIDDETSTANKT